MQAVGSDSALPSALAQVIILRLLAPVVFPAFLLLKAIHGLSDRITVDSATGPIAAALFEFGARALDPRGLFLDGFIQTRQEQSVVTHAQSDPVLSVLEATGVVTAVLIQLLQALQLLVQNPLSLGQDARGILLPALGDLSDRLHAF